MIIACDFDNVIHDQKNPIPVRRMGGVIEGTEDALRKLKRKGHTIIVHTVWGDEKGKQTIADFMKYYHLPYDSITNEKPRADCYLDDKAVRFTNWNQSLNDILNGGK